MTVAMMATYDNRRARLAPDPLRIEIAQRSTASDHAMTTTARTTNATHLKASRAPFGRRCRDTIPFNVVARAAPPRSHRALALRWWLPRRRLSPRRPHVSRSRWTAAERARDLDGVGRIDHCCVLCAIARS